MTAGLAACCAVAWMALLAMRRPALLLLLWLHPLLCRMLVGVVLLECQPLLCCLKQLAQGHAMELGVVRACRRLWPLH